MNKDQFHQKKEMKRIAKYEAIKNEYSFIAKHIKKGDRIATVLKHVSSSGMSRHIMFIIAIKRDNAEAVEAVNISHFVAEMIGAKMNKSGDAVVLGGCGMDMGFHGVYSFSRSFFYGEMKSGTTYGERNGAPDNDAGYWLKHYWL